MNKYFFTIKELIEKGTDLPLIPSTGEIWEILIDQWGKNIESERKKAKNELNQLNKKIKEVFKKDKSRIFKNWHELSMAIQIHLELLESPIAKNKYYSRLTEKQKHIIDISEKLPKEAKKITTRIKKEYENIFSKAQSDNVLYPLISNYITNLWDCRKEYYQKNEELLSTFFHLSPKQIYGTIIEGWALKDLYGKPIFKLKIKGAAENLYYLKKELNNLSETKKLIDTGLKISDNSDNKFFIRESDYIPGWYLPIENPYFKIWEELKKVPQKKKKKLLTNNRSVLIFEDGTIAKSQQIYASKEIVNDLNKLGGNLFPETKNKTQEMKKFLLENYFKIFLILFFIWIGYCAYKYSQNGKYKLSTLSPTAKIIINTRTGQYHKISRY